MKWEVRQGELLQEFVIYCRKRQMAEEKRISSLQGKHKRDTAIEVACALKETADFWENVVVVE